MIGLIFGENSDQYVNMIRESHYLKEVEGFSSIGAFIAAASRKALRCQRLVINCLAVNSEQEFYNLHKFLSENLRNTEVILFGRSFESGDLEVIQSYYTVFTEPIYTDYVLQPQEQANIDLLAKVLCKGSLDDIRLNHSAKKDEKPVVNYTKVAKEEEVVEPAFQYPKPMVAKEGVVKNFSFGGRIFSKKRLTKKERKAVSKLEDEVMALLQLG